MIKEKDRQEITRCLQYILLLIYTVLVCIVSLTEVSVCTVLNVRDIGSMTFVFVDLLFLIRLIGGKGILRKKRFCHLIYACFATALYMMYCRDLLIATVPGTVNDALNIAGILCILFVFSGKE